MSSSKASGDVHLEHASGTRFDVRGLNFGIFNMHQAAGISLNARFTMANYSFAPKDMRRAAIVEVDGSFITMVYALAQVHNQLIYITYGSEHPHKAVVRQEITYESTPEIRTSDVRVGEEVEIADVSVGMLKEKPVKLLISNIHWQYEITPGTYMTTNHQRHTKLDLVIVPLTNPMEAAVAPHGILGQGYDGYMAEGRRDQYVPDDHGRFVTSAQGEGAIEGNIYDYVVRGGTHSPDFRFSRFNMSKAVSRNVKGLRGMYVLKDVSFSTSAKSDEISEALLK